MLFSLEEIKRDIKDLGSRDFYLRHIVRSDNWYFQNVLEYSPSEINKISDDFKMIISESMGISFNSIMIVGSSKIGYSLSPTDKLFKPFCSEEGEGRTKSDIDVAIISSELFSKFWDLFRKNYSTKYTYDYKLIYTEIYRGYINEKRINNISECRKEWSKISSDSKKQLQDKLFIKHEVSYRIYRSWEDFEEYNLKNIEKIKKGIM